MKEIVDFIWNTNPVVAMILIVLILTFLVGFFDRGN